MKAMKAMQWSKRGQSSNTHIGFTELFPSAPDYLHYSGPQKEVASSSVSGLVDLTQSTPEEDVFHTFFASL